MNFAQLVHRLILVCIPARFSRDDRSALVFLGKFLSLSFRAQLNRTSVTSHRRVSMVMPSMVQLRLLQQQRREAYRHPSSHVIKHVPPTRLSNDAEPNPWRSLSERTLITFHHRTIFVPLSKQPFLSPPRNFFTSKM